MIKIRAGQKLGISVPWEIVTYFEKSCEFLAFVFAIQYVESKY